jgi:catechol 2,3-dioxygenase-like lactoylglutathione lyase family enzyme
MAVPETDPTKDPARCIPTLASLNIDDTLAFYTGQLGFRGERIGDYAIVKRDQMEIHFWLANDRIYPESTSCYIRGGQVVALYDEFKARGVEKLSDFLVRPWNMKEFYIHDPHGNLLRFGCAPEEI